MANVSDSLPLGARFSARPVMRAGLSALAIILALQAIWILYAEAYRLNRDQPLMDTATATITRADQERASRQHPSPLSAAISGLRARSATPDKYGGTGRSSSMRATLKVKKPA